MFLDVTWIDFFMYLGSLGERVPGIFWEKMYLGSLGKNVPWIFWEKYTWDLWEKCTWDLCEPLSGRLLGLGLPRPVVKAPCSMVIVTLLLLILMMLMLSLLVLMLTLMMLMFEMFLRLMMLIFISLPGGESSLVRDNCDHDNADIGDDEDADEADF